MTDIILSPSDLEAALREIEEGSCPPRRVRAVFRSIGSLDQIPVGLTLFHAADDELRTAALSGAYFDAGLIGIGYAVASVITDSPMFISSSFEAIAILKHAIVDARDVTAYRALIGLAGLSESLSLELADAREELRNSLGQSTLDELAASDGASADPSFLLSKLSSKAHTLRVIWMLKSFPGNSAAAEALSSCVADGIYEVSAAYILSCFFDIDMDLERLVERCAYDSFQNRLLLNLICWQGAKKKDRHAIKLLASAAEASMPREELINLENWVEHQISG